MGLDSGIHYDFIKTSHDVRVRPVRRWSRPIDAVSGLPFMCGAATECMMSFRAGNRLEDRGSNPNSIDKSLGIRLRAKRTSSGLSEEQLAEKLQIHPEDVFAYEKGEKRITALRLLHLAEALGVRPTYFFGFPDERQRGMAEEGARRWEGTRVYLTLPDQGVRLNRAFIGVKNAALREAIITLVVELAKSEKAD